MVEDVIYCLRSRSVWVVMISGEWMVVFDWQNLPRQQGLSLFIGNKGYYFLLVWRIISVVFKLVPNFSDCLLSCCLTWIKICVSCYRAKFSLWHMKPKTHKDWWLRCLITKISDFILFIFGWQNNCWIIATLNMVCTNSKRPVNETITNYNYTIRLKESFHER